MVLNTLYSTGRCTDKGIRKKILLINERGKKFFGKTKIKKVNFLLLLLLPPITLTGFHKLMCVCVLFRGQG